MEKKKTHEQSSEQVALVQAKWALLQRDNYLKHEQKCSRNTPRKQGGKHGSFHL